MIATSAPAPRAAANQYFLNAPGGLAFGGTVDPVNLNGDVGDPNNYSEYTVRTEPSAGNVPGVLDGVFAKGKRAIGILGLENDGVMSSLRKPVSSAKE